jgi:chaperonin GroEL
MSKVETKKKFSLFEQLEVTLKTLEDIDNSVKITLGPTGKNGIIANEKGELSFISTGSLLLKSLEFKEKAANVILKLLEQASAKTFLISGDGSTTTTLLSCDLLKNSLRFLINGYNPIFLSNGFKRISFFLLEKINEFSIPISNNDQLLGVLKTSIGRKINAEMFDLLKNCVTQFERDGLILVEENTSEKNEVEIVQGIEIDRGFASSYFVNDLKNFEVVYEKPTILITNNPINNLNQIREIIEYIKTNNKSLVIVAEEISKDIISTLVLNNIQKKLKVAVVKYSAIKFIKNGLLEDLATLTHSTFFEYNPKLKESEKIFKIEDLGQAEKVIIKKEKSTFIISKFSKLIAKRRINELNRELLLSESEYEKNIFKTRIARLSGNISKIKVGLSNKYQIEEQRKKVENVVNTLKSALEEGILPGGGSFYLHLRNELKSWSSLNLIGEEFFASQIILSALLRPFEQLFSNNNLPSYHIRQKIEELGYPYAYNLMDKKIVNSLNNGLLDSSKSIRAIIWNSISIISTIITSD